MSVETPKPKKTSLKTWLIFLTVVGFLAWWLVPDMMISQKLYMNRAYESMVKAELKALYTACNAYWAETDPDQECNSETAKQMGYEPHPRVSIQGSGTRDTFSATARHADLEAVIKIDAKGIIR